MDSYAEFLGLKAQHGARHGFEPNWIPDFLFDFQKSLAEWAILKGRGGIWADCGLGKTPMQLVWAENVVRETNRPVLILTPLAVAAQTKREADKFGIEAIRSSGEFPSGSRVVLTNYEKLHHFNAHDFSGVVIDESAILKNFDGKRKAAITEFMRVVPYRLLCTATAAPNDYIELGTSSEALGELGYMDVLNRFFKNDQNNSSTKKSGFIRSMPASVADKMRWRFKGHAEQPFWRWVCSWSRACRRPSDLGFDDKGFILPPLIEQEHVVKSATLPNGFLFPVTASNLREEREERRRTIQERCETAAALVANTGKQAVVWCHLNDEGDMLSEMIRDSRQVSGQDSDESKEEAYEAFSSGQLRVLVIKPKIGAWGINWQNCSHTVTFASHSYEQYYQAVRRFWRFGQKDPVTVDLVITEGEGRVKENMQRKAKAADRMFTELVKHMGEAMRIDGGAKFDQEAAVPAWM